jgi:uncharacterized protein YciI
VGIAAQAWGQSQPSYFLVLLKRAEHPTQMSQEAREKLQSEHMANIRKMYNEGRLVMAGPFMDDTNLRGIFVLTANSREQAQQWVNEDPTIKAGRLVAEVHGPWMIPAGAIKKASDENEMQQYTFVFGYRGGESNGHDTEHLATVGTGDGTALAGVMQDDGDLRAVTVRTEGVQQTTKLTEAERGFRFELHPWATAKGVLPPGEPLKMN